MPTTLSLQRVIKVLQKLSVSETSTKVFESTDHSKKKNE